MPELDDEPEDDYDDFENVELRTKPNTIEKMEAIDGNLLTSFTILYDTGENP